MKEINILDVRIDALRKQEALEKIKGFLDDTRQIQIATINPEFVMETKKQPRFKDILNSCDLNLADGIGLLWAAKYLEKKIKSNDKSQSRNYNLFTIVKKVVQSLWDFGYLVVSGASLIFWPRYCKSVIPERIGGVDMMVDICAIAEKENKKVFLLGGWNDIAEKTAQELKLKFPKLRIGSKLKIENWELGDHNHDMSVISSVNEFQADIFFVAANHPKAQYWIADNLAKLSSVKIAMGVGGAFDFISGKAKRAPKVLRNLGLEWLWRLMLQPWRLPRIITATVKFIKLVIVNK